MSEATPPSVKRRRLDLTESFKLIIGWQKQEIMVHKDILTKSSDFFKACCNGHNWKESATKTVELPEDDIDAVTCYVQYLYSGEVIVHDEAIEAHALQRSIEERGEIAGPRNKALCMAAVLADKFGDAAFTNAIADCILDTVDKTGVYPGGGTLKLMYPALPRSSPIVRMICAFWQSRDRQKLEDTEMTSLPAEFVWDLMIKLHKEQGQKKESYPTFADRCKYHIHNDQVPKCK